MAMGILAVSTHPNISPSSSCNGMDLDDVRKMDMSLPRLGGNPRSNLAHAYQALDVDPGPTAVYIRPSGDVFDDGIDLPAYTLYDAKSEIQQYLSNEKY